MLYAVIWFRRVPFSEGATDGVFKKRLLLKIPPNLQENTCAGVFFLSLLFILFVHMVGMDPSINFRGQFAIK